MRVSELCLDRLGSGRDRRQVGIAQGELRLQRGERLSDLALLAFERTQPLVLLRLLLLDLRQPIGERAGIIRVRRHRGDEEQQRQKGAACSGNYAGGAPAEPGVGGSRRGVKATSPNGAGAFFGDFSFFFFLTSRLPLSRDFAMDPASQT